MKSDKGKEDLTRLLISDSLLPDIFLVRYAQELSKNALLVYLWLNMTGAGEGFDEALVRKNLPGDKEQQISDSDIVLIIKRIALSFSRKGISNML